MELSGFPVAICDAHGKVCVFNRLAKRLFGLGEGVFLEEGVLQCPGARRQLASALSEATQAADRHTPSHARVVHVQRPGEASTLTLLVYPIAEHIAGPAQPEALVVFGYSEAAARPSASFLSELYGLTPQEAKVASLLAQGQSTAGIAARLRVTRETIKSHLRSLFSKTDTNGQVELVAKVLGNLGRLPRTIAI